MVAKKWPWCCTVLGEWETVVELIRFGATANLASLIHCLYVLHSPTELNNAWATYQIGIVYTPKKMPEGPSATRQTPAPKVPYLAIPITCSHRARVLSQLLHAVSIYSTPTVLHDLPVQLVKVYKSEGFVKGLSARSRPPYKCTTPLLSSAFCSYACGLVSISKSRFAQQPWLC